MNKKDLQITFPNFEDGLYDDILAHGEIIQVSAGDIILKVGQTIRSTMLIVDGLIKLYRENDEGKEFFIYHLDAGQACSLSMVCATQHETSEMLAKAITDTTLLSIPLQYMEEWMGKYKTWYQFVITSYRSRFEELLRTIDAIAFIALDERLEFYLKTQVEKMGNRLKITHQEIANDLNSSREVISRLLKKMEGNGWLTMDRNSIQWKKEG